MTEKLLLCILKEEERKLHSKQLQLNGWENCVKEEMLLPNAFI